MDWLFNPLPKAGMDWVFGVVPTAESLKTYKYRSPNLSLFERLFLDDFWGWLPGHVYPAWLAPNAITCAGLGAIAGMTPVWLYQTLDGSDGKQARATKSGSALGEVMDHGVDALATVLITVSSMDMAAFGASSWCTWTPVLTSCAGFYLSNMVLIHKGRQDFQEVDIQEMLCGIQVAFGIGAWRGARFFRRALPLGLTPRWLFVVAGSGGSVANCAMYVASVSKTDKPGAPPPQFLALGVPGAAAFNVATLGGRGVAPFVLAATAAFGDACGLNAKSR
ncbi:diacylglycerol cholinephosphotransferase [Aureococcus anophagefferens]|nr:diacylglycerol cholinephosphotransferase [Aureococcus anophagefferens]